jgi:putative hydrolase of the HAD superfamily
MPAIRLIRTLCVFSPFSCYESISASEGMNLKAVFFDMGGTIDTHTYDREAGVLATADIRLLLSRCGVTVRSSDEELYERINEGLSAYRRWREACWIELPPETVWREFVLKACPISPGQLSGVAEDLAYTVDTRYYQRRMRPEVPQVLELLKGMGLKLGIISNIQSRGQVPTDLRRYGIQHFFDPVVLSCEYGRRKPDPGIFHFAARQAGASAGCCAHVGDRISRDILGAKQAGFALAVQIRHEYTESEEPEEPRADAVIDSLEELPLLLKRASQS